MIVPDVKELSQNLSSNMEDFLVFCELFVSEVVGKVVWNKSVKNKCKPFGVIATVTDVACAILLVENGKPYWDAMADKDGDDTETTEKTEKTATAYTFVVGQKERDTDKADKLEPSYVRGWSNRGIKRYAELIREVAKDRNQNGEAFDKFFIESMEKKYGGKGKCNSNKNKKKKSLAAMPRLQLYHIEGHNMATHNGGNRERTSRSEGNGSNTNRSNGNDSDDSDNSSTSTERDE